MLSTTDMVLHLALSCQPDPQKTNNQLAVSPQRCCCCEEPLTVELETS
jgi:hypothetical protein